MGRSNHRGVAAIALGLLATSPLLALGIAMLPEPDVPLELPDTSVVGRLAFVPSRGRGTTPHIDVTRPDGEKLSLVCGLRHEFVEDGVIPCGDVTRMHSLLDDRQGRAWYFRESALVFRVVELRVDQGPQFEFADQIDAIRENTKLSRRLMQIMLGATVGGLWPLMSYLIYRMIRMRSPGTVS